jgi:protein involved in polysaccharide export with SLBB domain
MTMFRKTVLFIGISMLVACGGNVPSVKTLADQQQTSEVLGKSNDSYLIGPGDVLSVDGYGDYVEIAEVSVTLMESHSKKIYLLGKVNSPGEYVLQKNMTIVQAISLAGGLAEWADSSDIKLIRKIKGTEKTFRVDYDAIVSGEDMAQNVHLQPDDTIFVP